MYALYSMYMFYVHKFALNIFLRFKEKAWSLNFFFFFFKEVMIKSDYLTFLEGSSLNFCFAKIKTY